jgi:hypothetical protein
MEITRKDPFTGDIQYNLNITGEEMHSGKRNTYIQDAFPILLERKESLLKQESI